MLPQTPGENARPGARRAHYKDWFVYRSRHSVSLAGGARGCVVSQGDESTLSDQVCNAHPRLLQYRRRTAFPDWAKTAGFERYRCVLLTYQLLSPRAWPRSQFGFIETYFGCTLSVMNPIKISPGGEFSLGGENFLIEVAVPPKDRRPSTADVFTIAKNEPYLRVYEDLASRFSPRSILELGIFQGGSYVFLDKLFKPRQMSAVEISSRPVAPLMDYVSCTENRFVHFGTSQCDNEMLKQIVQGELADELDLVVDDASHTYEETRASFEVLFPLLSPGGIYVIEDWSWAHHPDYQSPDAPFSKRRALSNLLFEQIMLMGSALLISEIRVWRFLYMIHKGKAPVRRSDLSQTVERGSIFDQILSRGKKWSLI
jgi:predicted O-methyltransferase YrrM